MGGRAGRQGQARTANDRDKTTGINGGPPGSRGWGWVPMPNVAPETKEEHVHEADQTTLRPPPQVSPPSLGVPRPGMVDLGPSGRVATPAAPGPGQAFADLLVVAAMAARCPLALFSVTKDGAWRTLSSGAGRESLDDPELFSIVASQSEPVEVTDPANNPALARTRLARSDLGVRWVLAVPLAGPNRRPTAVFAVLDTSPHELSSQKRAALMAVGRLASGVLAASVATITALGEPVRHGGTTDAVQLLRSYEVAALFDVTDRTVVNWASSGELACLRTVGGHLRFRSEDVMAVLEAVRP